jgi:hypothetical protein
MRKIKQLDTQSLKALRLELDTVLEKFSKKSGVEIKTGGIRYTSNTATIKLEAKVAGSKSKDASALEFFTKFKENDQINIKQLGQVKVVGYNTKAKKYPYVVESIKNNKRYKLSENQIEARLNIV